MYLLKEGSQSTSHPLLQRIEDDEKDRQSHYTMFVPSAETARWFFSAGMAEKPLIEWVIQTFVRPDQAMIDIGAHVGTYTWTSARKAAHVYSFECSPRTFCYLAANIALHGLEHKVTPLPFALGNEERQIDYILRAEDGGGNGVKRLNDADDHLQTVPVQMKTLDSFNLTNIGFIKIDVEGFEKEVLEGAVRTLENNNYPPILFESWGEWKKDVDTKKLREDLFTWLSTHDYSITPIRNATDMFLATSELSELSKS